jgi:hypothetical protein
LAGISMLIYIFLISYIHNWFIMKLVKLFQSIISWHADETQHVKKQIWCCQTWSSFAPKHEQ